MQRIKKENKGNEERSETIETRGDGFLVCCVFVLEEECWFTSHSNKCHLFVF